MRFLLRDFLRRFAAASPLANAGNHQEVLRIMRAAPSAAGRPDDPADGCPDAAPFAATSVCPTVVTAR